MKKGTLRSAAMLIACGLLGACQSGLQRPLPVVEPALAEPTVPPGYRKIAPTAVESSRDILHQTAAVFRGRVASIHFTFDDCSGPRTHYVFANAKTLLGTPVNTDLTLTVFGGPTPRGTWLRAADLEVLARDSEYTVFLRNTDWTFSPVVRNLAFRADTIAGRDVLIDPEGYLLTGWGDDGPLRSSQAVTAAVGTRVTGYRQATATRPPQRVAIGVPTTLSPPLQRGSGGELTSSRPPPVEAASEQGPTREELVNTRRFERPPLLPDAPNAAVRDALTSDALVAALQTEATRQNIQLGGKVVLKPYWRCWSTTPTVTASRPQ